LWRLNGRAVDDLIITDYPNARLPGDVFPNTVSIKRIVIADSPELTGFGPKLKPDKTFFANLGHSLESIVVNNCPNVDDREWVNIGETLAKGNAVPVLKHLTIGSDKNYLIADPKAFAKLANIETLTLRANALTTFTEDLTVFKALKFLDLTANRQLKTFNPPALPNTLSNILLAETAITHLAHETIAMLKHVDFVDLRKNPLSCYCEDIQEICDREDLQRKFVGALCATPVGKNNTIFGTSCEWEFPPSTKPPTTVATESSDTNGTTIDTDDTASQTFAKFLYRLMFPKN
ncbi:unnamed protein product, partial [Medioppia subpectinata]